MALAAVAPQMGLEEKPLDDPTGTLETQLRIRDEASEAMKPHNKKKKEATAAAKALISQMELPDGTYRLGEYIVKISETEEKEVEFTRSAGTRISMRRAKKQ